MSAGQFYPGEKLLEAPEVHDGLITYTAGVAGKTPDPATPAVGSTATNANSFNVNVYLYGGTVSAVTVNGSTVATATGGHVHLNPGDQLALTYSAAPSWFWQAA